MKSVTQCLQPADIKALLSGTVPASQNELWEMHFSSCESCRIAMAGQVGDQEWWREAEHSLMNASIPEERDAVKSEADERESIEELLKLLGPTDDPNMLGRIGSYEIVGLLGQGGMGVVFKGFDRSLNRFVAIKMLLPHLAASGAARKRFAREAQAVAAVVDDHVMAIHCVDEWQGVPYLVMTYSRGITLQKRLSDNGPLEVREILRIGMQAAKGLAAAHAQGIVHRDIKPANIFLDQNVERVQLMDFGLARAVDDASLTRSGTLAGTPQYMSPEQARAETVDHRSDLFSLGSVMYAMCTGHAPFRAESSYSVLRLITDKEPRPIREINPDVPEWLCTIIRKLMAKQASDRYQSAKEGSALLEECLAHLQQPTSTPLPASLVPHAPTVCRSVLNVTRTGVMIMLGIFGMTLLGMVLWQATEPPDFNGQQTTNRAESRLANVLSNPKPAPVISNVTIADKTATVTGIGGDDLDCVLRIGKSKKNAQLEWTSPVTGQFSATITASDRMPSDKGKLAKGLVLTVQNAKSSNTSNIAMSDSGTIPAGEVRFRQQSAMDRADTSWTFADIHCDDGTTIPISILLRANKPLLPPGPLVYEGKVQEWVGGDRDGPTLPSGNYKPVPSAILQLYKVSPIIKGGSGYQFEEIAVFETDKEGHFKISIPDDLKRFIPTPHTKEWDDWESLLLITTSAPGFATHSTTLAANHGLSFIELTRGTSISGRLVDENGKPVVGAQVSVNQQSRSSVKEMDEWLRQTSSETLPAAKIDPADTAAILAARTNASIANHSMHWIPTMIEGVITDQDGRFTIDGIGPDDVLDLTVERLGYNNASIKVVGRDMETVYSRDPFGSGENIAVHGRNFQVALVASDRSPIHNRHRIIKGERTKGPNELGATGETRSVEQQEDVLAPALQTEDAVTTQVFQVPVVNIEHTQPLVGVWTVETIISAGEVIPPPSNEIEFRGNQMIWKRTGKVAGEDKVYDFDLDMSKSPHWLTFRSQDPKRPQPVLALLDIPGRPQAKREQGDLQVNGEQLPQLRIFSLRDASGNPSTERPTQIGTGEEPCTDLMVLKLKSMPILSSSIVTRSPRSVVEAYIASALTGDVAKAAALAKNSPVDPKRIKELPEFLNVQRLKIETVYVNDPAKPTRALATSQSVKLDEEHKQPDGQRDGFMVFRLELTDDKWFVIDIDFESESGAEKELKRFLEANPNSIGLPPLTSSSMPNQNPATETSDDHDRIQGAWQFDSKSLPTMPAGNQFSVSFLADRMSFRDLRKQELALSASRRIPSPNRLIVVSPLPRNSLNSLGFMNFMMISFGFALPKANSAQSHLTIHRLSPA